MYREMLEALWGGAVRINGAIVAVVSQMLLSKILGLQEFGALAQAVAFYAIFEGVIITRAGDVAVYALAQTGGGGRVHPAFVSDLVCFDLLCGIAGCIIVMCTASVVFSDRSGAKDVLFILSVGLPLSAGYGYWRNAAFLRSESGAFLRAEAVLPWVRATGGALAALRWGTKGVAVWETAYVFVRSFIFYSLQKALRLKKIRARFWWWAGERGML